MSIELSERNLRLEHKEAVCRIKESELMGRIRELFANDPLFQIYNTHKNHVDFLDIVEDATYFGQIVVEWQPSEDVIEDWIKDVLNKGQNTGYDDKPLDFTTWCAYEVYERQPDFGLDNLHYTANLIIEKMRSGDNEDLRSIAKKIESYDMVDAMQAYYDMIDAMQAYDVIFVELEVIKPELRANLLLGTKTEIDNDFDSIPQMIEALFEDKTAKRMLDDNKLLSRNMDNALSQFMESSGFSLADAMTSEKTNSISTAKTRTEIENYPTNYQGCLTVLLKAKPDTLFEILTSPSIKINSSATVGLYSPLQGSGSQMGIDVQPDGVTIPNLIYDVEIEDSSRSITVDKVFSMTSRCWQKDAVVGVQEQPDPKLLTPKIENIGAYVALIQERMTAREKESEEIAPR